MITVTASDRSTTYVARYDGAQDTARLSAEIMQRLVEMDEIHMTSAADLCRRLGTLADISPTMFMASLRLGSGDVGAVRRSFAEMAAATGRTRQALHYEWAQEVAKLKTIFPALAQLMIEYRQSTDEPHRSTSQAPEP